jgi:hypothetical protein
MLAIGVMHALRLRGVRVSDDLAVVVGIVHNWASMAPDEAGEADRARIADLYGSAVQRLVEPPGH